MKVGKGSVSSSSASYTGSVGKAYGKVREAQVSNNVRDSFEVSESGAVFRQALDAAGRTPEIRTEPVAKMKRELEAGTYQRDESVIADKIIQDHIAPSE